MSVEAAFTYSGAISAHHWFGIPPRLRGNGLHRDAHRVGLSGPSPGPPKPTESRSEVGRLRSP